MPDEPPPQPPSADGLRALLTARAAESDDDAPPAERLARLRRLLGDGE